MIDVPQYLSCACCPQHHENFCPDSVSSLHMLLHSTSVHLRHGVLLPTSHGVPRHMFVDPMARADRYFVQLDIDVAYPLPPPPPPQSPGDWAHRMTGGVLLMDRRWEPRHVSHRMQAGAADPRYQADLLLQWMTSPQLTDNVLTLADAVLLSQTSCAAASAACSGSCEGYWDAECGCHPASQPPVSCMTPSESSPYCDPASGSRSSCPYSAVTSADLELRAHPGCKKLTTVANGLSGVHADVRRFLESAEYPWQQFVLTILVCPGTGGRLSDVTVGFPAAYRSQLRSAGLPVNRNTLCGLLRVYITNAEAMVRGGDSRMTHETFCLDDLVLSPVVHLARPRRPPPAAAPGARDAVHLWLGSAQEGVTVDLNQIVVKLYSVPAELTVVTPYVSQHEMNAEELPAGECVVEIEGKNETRTTLPLNTTVAPNTTMSPINISDAAGAMTSEQLAATGTGSIFGIAMLLLLLAYCMCQRTAGGGDWESESSWSQSPASWTTSSTSSWTSTPSSSADGYSTESFDFERDAHLVGNRATLQYMRRVQEEALRRRRLQTSGYGGTD